MFRCNPGLLAVAMMIAWSTPSIAAANNAVAPTASPAEPTATALASRTRHNKTSTTTARVRHRKAKRSRSGRGVVPGNRNSPAYRYGTLSPEDCQAELTQRAIAFDVVEARGVAAPVRIRGPLHGVEFRSNDARTNSTDSIHEIADCRLVLALDDFAAILATHNVIAVEHYSMYRPPSQRWPTAKVARQHAGALSIDAAHFVRQDEKTLTVLDDFHGAIGAKTCGPKAKPRRSNAAALEMRAILCEAVAAQLFNVVLTPNHNRPHRNHFHMELMHDTEWFLVD
ncbi:MAG: extensin family protein [Kofleriaceae bacterium]|nr:extensin family protein [Kofleriaceae bacterium]